LLIFKHSFLSCIQCSNLRNAHIAQSVEHFLGKEEVIGSNPIVSTKVRECSGVSGCMNKRGRANLHC
jgi:hypothetical protein